jgi:hypothetical protein
MSAYNNALSLSHRSIPMAASFAFGKPPSNPIVTSQPGWTPIPGYDDSMPNMLRAVGIGLAFAATLAIAWHSLVPQGLSYDASPALLSMVLVFLIVTVGHEICHLLPFPRLGFGNAVLGLWLQVGGLYIQYLQPVTRSRFIVVLLSSSHYFCRAVGCGDLRSGSSRICDVGVYSEWGRGQCGSARGRSTAPSL